MKVTLFASMMGMSLMNSAVAASAPQLSVTVYDEANLPARDAKQVADTLRSILRHSNIEVQWIGGQPGADEASLVTYTNIVSRKQERRLACRARRDIAVSIKANAPSGTPLAVLGRALPFASEGVNVQIYAGRVAAAATAREVPAADIMAHAMAHEIGHVLLRTNVHNGNGLMAGVWTGHEYTWIKTGSMFFTSGEGERMRASINGVGCPAVITRKE